MWRLVRILPAVICAVGLLSVASAQPPGGPGDRGPGDGPGGPGGRGPGGPPRPGTVLPSFLQEQLKLTSEQKKQLNDLQKDVDSKLDKILTDDQKKQLKEMRPGRGGPGGPGGGGPGGPGGGGPGRGGPGGPGGGGPGGGGDRGPDRGPPPNGNP